MKKGFTVFAVASILALFLSSSSLAAWGVGTGGGGRGRGMMNGGKGGSGFCQSRIVSQLDLTQDQMKKAVDREQAVERDALARRQENEKLRLEMGQELKKDSPDKAKLDRYIDQINRNRAENQKKRTEYMLWFKSQLTPEQKQKFGSCFKNMEAGHRNSKRPDRGCQSK